MAERKFYADIDLSGNHLLNVVLEGLAADPVSLQSAGRFFYDTEAKKLKYFDGTSFQTVATADGMGDYLPLTGGILTGPLTAPSILPKDSSSGIGAASSKFATAYINTVYGSLSGNASTASALDHSFKITLNGVEISLGTLSGTSATAALPLATSAINGLMSAADKDKLDKISGTVIVPKGSVATFEDLPAPSESNIGWMYNVIAAHGDTPAGTNYVSTGTEWDPLGGTIDLSGYVTKAEANYTSEFESGRYVTQVTQTNGVLSASTASLKSLLILAGQGVRPAVFTPINDMSLTLKSGEGIDVNNSETDLWTFNFNLKAATTSALGGIKLFENALRNPIICQPSTSTHKYYAVQLDKNNKAFVDIPWENTTYTALPNPNALKILKDSSNSITYDGSAALNITLGEGLQAMFFPYSDIPGVSISLATTGVSAGTYSKVSVDAYGRVTNGASLTAGDIPGLPWSKITSGKPTTLAGYGITDAASSSDLDDVKAYYTQCAMVTQTARTLSGNAQQIYWVNTLTVSIGAGTTFLGAFARLDSKLIDCEVTYDSETSTVQFSFSPLIKSGTVSCFAFYQQSFRA